MDYVLQFWCFFLERRVTII